MAGVEGQSFGEVTTDQVIVVADPSTTIAQE
jgi:hypothetical protein